MTLPITMELDISSEVGGKQMRKAPIWGIMIVLIGIFYIAQQLHAITWNVPIGRLWPLIFTFSGFSGLSGRRRRSIPWWSLYFVVLGILLTLQNIGFPFLLTQIGAWPLTVGLWIIFVGLSMTAPQGKRGAMITFQRVNRKSSEWKCSTNKQAMKTMKWMTNDEQAGQTSSRKIIGDMSIGASPWVLKDMNMWNGIGDVRVNLATAHIEEGEYLLDIGGFIGDVRILVPQALSVQVKAHVGIGDIHVFDSSQDGFDRDVFHEDVDFVSATRRVIINTHLKIGDIQVVRV